MYTKFKILDSYIEKDDTVNAIIRYELLKYCRLNLSEELCNKWDSYLKTYNTNLLTVIKNVVSTLDFTNNEGDYVVAVDTIRRMKENNEKIITMAKLIDKGNFDIKGLNILSNGLAYIKRSINNILKRYYGVK